MKGKSSNGIQLLFGQFFFQFIEEVEASFLKEIENIFEARIATVIRIWDFVYIWSNIITKWFNF